MNVAVIGAGNVGVAIAADLSAKGADVSLYKSSSFNSEVFDRLLKNNGRVYLKESGALAQSAIKEVTTKLEGLRRAEVIFVTIQSTYHEALYQRICQYLNSEQIVVCICSYMSSFYLAKYCSSLPIIAETTGPYLEGRVMLDIIPDEVVFRVGCRLTRSPLSIFNMNRREECMLRLKTLYEGFECDYSTIECALLNPNMVLHTVGAIMSIPRIEYSRGVFCMYREAYSRSNQATLKVMLKLDEEKKEILRTLGCRPIDIYKAGGFLGNPEESFFKYSESEDRALSPTSVKSRYITEDVSQGLVLLESIAQRAGVKVPITSSLINIASAALCEDFRANGRTIQRLNSVRYIDTLREYGYFIRH